MNWQLLARFALRMTALAAVSLGAPEETANVILMNADLVALVALGLAELWFVFSKAIGRVFK